MGVENVTLFSTLPCRIICMCVVLSKRGFQNFNSLSEFFIVVLAIIIIPTNKIAMTFSRSIFGAISPLDTFCHGVHSLIHVISSVSPSSIFMGAKLTLVIPAGMMTSCFLSRQKLINLSEFFTLYPSNPQLLEIARCK